AHLRAQLDAFYFHKYGLTEEETAYVLDPKAVYGADFPGETFRSVPRSGGRNGARPPMDRRRKASGPEKEETHGVAVRNAERAPGRGSGDRSDRRWPPR